LPSWFEVCKARRGVAQVAGDELIKIGWYCSHVFDMVQARRGVGHVAGE
jgi:hypothetical protein